MSNYTRIKRTIQTLKCRYPLQHICRENIIYCLSNDEFQYRYIEY